jgi:hypothetical protein
MAFLGWINAENSNLVQKPDKQNNAKKKPLHYIHFW